MIQGITDICKMATELDVAAAARPTQEVPISLTRHKRNKPLIATMLQRHKK